MVKAQIVAFPRRTPQISSERLRNFCARRKVLNEIRESLERSERSWEAERDALVADLVDGAKIEQGGG